MMQLTSRVKVSNLQGLLVVDRSLRGPEASLRVGCHPEVVVAVVAGVAGGWMTRPGHEVVRVILVESKPLQVEVCLLE